MAIDATVDLIKEFSALEAMTIGGFVGIDQVMNPEIKPVGPTMRFAGRALTLRGAAISKAVLKVVGPGDVLIIDTGGDTKTGVWGHLMTLAVRAKGAHAVVVDGAVFHSSHLRSVGFPVFSRTASAYAGASKIDGDMQIPVQCGDVTVHPGDIVVGDSDGVVVVPQDRAPEILGRAKLSQEAHALSRRICEEQGIDLTQLPYIEEQWEEKDRLPREKTYVAFAHWLRKVKELEASEYIKWLDETSESVD